MRTLIVVFCLMSYGTCAFGADRGKDDSVLMTLNRCQKMSAIIEKIVVMKKNRATDSGSICTTLKKDFAISDTGCRYFGEQAQKIQNTIKSDDPAKTRQSYFDTCIESEQAQTAKNPDKNESAGRFATAKDLHGAYELVVQPEWIDRARNKVPDPFQEKYQYFIFSEDGQFNFISSSQKIGDIKTRKELQKLVDEVKATSGKSPQAYYRFLKDGSIFIYHKNRPNLGVVWGVNIVKTHMDFGEGPSGKMPVWEPGDILLSLDKNGVAVYHKQLRPIKE